MVGSANVLTDTALASRSELQTGFPLKSKADSALIGKLMQNATAGAYAVGEFSAKYGTTNITGSDAIGFATAFESALESYVEQKAPSPDLSNYATKADLDDKADVSSLANYAPIANPIFTGSVTVPAPSADASAATKQYVDSQITSLNVSQYATTSALTSGLATKADTSALANYAPLTGAAFTGAVTVQEPTAASNPATKQYVDSAVSSVLKYKGTVANQAALPQSDQTVGDVWTTQDSNKEFAWDGTKWIELGPTIDLSGYLTTESASATYLSKTEAQSAYQPKGDYATNTALTQGLAGKADTATLANYLPVAGGTITGNLAVSGTLTGTLTGSATSATQDASGNIITTTYATKTELANKADSSALANYAPLASPAFTGTATLGGQTIATVNQIPDTSTLATKTELNNYLPLAGGTVTGETEFSDGIRVYNSVTAYPNITIMDGGSIGIGDNSGDLRLDPSGASGDIKLCYYTDTDPSRSSILASDILPKTGSRGTLAGYETTSVGATALTINQNSPDSQQLTAAVSITVHNGSPDTAWVKKVSIKDAGVTISLDVSWTWVGGSQPTVTAPSLLVLSWDNDCGMAILNTTG